MDKLNLKKLASVVLIAIGIILLIYMVTYEDEPGALPLFLILFGIIGFYFTKKKS